MMIDPTTGYLTVKEIEMVLAHHITATTGKRVKKVQMKVKTVSNGDGDGSTHLVYDGAEFTLDDGGEVQ